MSKMYWPTTREGMDQMAREVMAIPETEIIDESGWINYRQEKYFLYQRDPDSKPEDPCRRFIGVLLVKERTYKASYRCMDENEGPNADNCPLRLIENADQYPPANEFARNWRQRVRDRQREKGEVRRIVETLRKEYPGGTQQLVLRDGRQVRYGQGRYKGRRNTAAYWDPETGDLTLLSKEKIDPQATRRLWAETAR